MSMWWPKHGTWGRRSGLTLPRTGDLFVQYRERLCRWCLGPIAGGVARSWCSGKCSANFDAVSSWARLRQYIITRDKSCQRCGTTSPGWNPNAPIVRVYDSARLLDPCSQTAQAVELLPWWEVDHIRPLSDGGDDNPSNLRLVCHHCHIIVSREQRASIRERARVDAAEDQAEGAARTRGRVDVRHDGRVAGLDGGEVRGNTGWEAAPQGAS